MRGLKSDFILSINDAPEIRELFAWASIFEVPTTYTAAKDAAKQVQELVISSIGANWLKDRL